MISSYVSAFDGLNVSIPTANDCARENSCTPIRRGHHNNVKQQSHYFEVYTLGVESSIPTAPTTSSQWESPSNRRNNSNSSRTPATRQERLLHPTLHFQNNITVPGCLKSTFYQNITADSGTRHLSHKCSAHSDSYSPLPTLPPKRTGSTPENL